MAPRHAGRVRVHAEAPIRPTEDPEAVARAVSAFFPGAEVRVEPGRAWLGSDAPDAVDALRRRIWELRIIDTVRSRLLAGADGDTVRLRLSKQAALGGRISLPPSPHALGELEITVRLEPDDRWPDGEAWCWWLCPETKDGEIVGPAD